MNRPVADSIYAAALKLKTIKYTKMNIYKLVHVVPKLLDNRRSNLNDFVRNFAALLVLKKNFKIY